MPNFERIEVSDAQRVAQPRTDALGRVLIAVYLILALAATLRAIYQIISKFDEAPVAYSLSLASGVVYVIATIALMRRTGHWRTVAWAALIFEFTGVLIVGVLSFTMPVWFAHDSVWSFFGMNYFWIPLVLPVLGMIWLRRDTRDNAERQGAVAGKSEGRY
ncbi:hypothetical protein [Leucobacter sp. W1478]|uniref:hypothetical protein n=1 Tax=Leucobacter sp. W1478 TaxID=3439065 RepID=UPI003F2A585F